jgi:cytochrome c-550 PedF
VAICGDIKMKTFKPMMQTASAALLALASMNAIAHGNVTPQAVDTSALPQLGDEWKTTNPFTGNELAIEIGDSAYNQNCARCHGLEVISGGITPDLRKLNDPNEFFSPEEADEWFMTRIRHGAVVDGRVYMPPFEGILSQEAMWAIKAYIETRELDE